MNCPTCQATINPDDVNVAADTAFCRSCNFPFAFSSIVHSPPSSAQQFAQPSGTWDRDDGMERRIGASIRSRLAFFFVPFFLLWSGFSVGMIYGPQLWNRSFDLTRSLMGIPFLFGSLILGSVALILAFGRIEVRIRADDGRVMSGAGPLSWTRRFRVSDVTGIREAFSGITQNGRPLPNLVLDAGRAISFGASLTSPRRQFMFRSLQMHFSDRKPRRGPRPA